MSPPLLTSSSLSLSLEAAADLRSSSSVTWNATCSRASSRSIWSLRSLSLLILRPFSASSASCSASRSYDI